MKLAALPLLARGDRAGPEVLGQHGITSGPKWFDITDTDSEQLEDPGGMSHDGGEDQAHHGQGASGCQLGAQPAEKGDGSCDVAEVQAADLSPIPGATPAAGASKSRRKQKKRNLDKGAEATNSDMVERLRALAKALGEKGIFDSKYLDGARRLPRSCRGEGRRRHPGEDRRVVGVGYVVTRS